MSVCSASSVYRAAIALYIKAFEPLMLNVLGDMHLQGILLRVWSSVKQLWQLHFTCSQEMKPSTQTDYHITLNKFMSRGQ